MAKNNKNNTEPTFTDNRILGEQDAFNKAKARLIAWVDDMGKKTLSEAFSGGREGMPFSALNLGIISLIGQGGIRERWLKTCSDLGRENVNIGDFILANICPETEEERKARIEREKALAVATAKAEAVENSFAMFLGHVPTEQEIVDKKGNIEPDIYDILLTRAQERAKA